MPIPTIQPGPATGWGFGQYIETQRKLQDQEDCLKNSPAPKDPELQEELKKEKQQSK